MSKQLLLGARYWSGDALRWAATESIIETCRTVEKLANVISEGNVRIAASDMRELRAALDRLQELLDGLCVSG